MGLYGNCEVSAERQNYMLIMANFQSRVTRSRDESGGHVMSLKLLLLGKVEVGRPDHLYCRQRNTNIIIT